MADKDQKLTKIQPLPVEGRAFYVDAPTTDGDFDIIDREANVIAWSIPDNDEETDSDRVYRVFATAAIGELLELARRAANGEAVGPLASRVLDRIDLAIEESIDEDDSES